MADEDKTAAGAADHAASSSPAEKPATPRKRAAVKKADGAQAAVKAPGTRAAAKKADGADAPVKAPRARAAAKKADAQTPPKPVLGRAAEKSAEPAVAASAAAEVVSAPEKAPARTAAKAPAKTPAKAPAKTAAAARPARRGAPARESAKRVPAGLTVRAQARYVRSSARKARLVCDHIRGKSVPEARALLAFAPRGVAKDWSKLLNSAVANAENNHELVGDELTVTAVYADEGPTLKRFTPRAMGRATPIHKRTSHLTIELGSKE